MSKYHDDGTTASDPGGFRLVDDKLRGFHPYLYSFRARMLSWYPPGLLFVAPHRLLSNSKMRNLIAEHLLLGDSRAALVVGTNPLLVAAYTDELDCVAILSFRIPDECQDQLQVGSRLITVNTYFTPDLYAKASDLINGPRQYGNYHNFWPIIADFLTDDVSLLEVRKRFIDEEEWDRTRTMADRRLSDSRFKARNGAPLFSWISSRCSG